MFVVNQSLPVPHHEILLSSCSLPPVRGPCCVVKIGYQSETDENHGPSKHQRPGNASHNFNGSLAVAYDNEVSNQGLVDEWYAHE